MKMSLPLSLSPLLSLSLMYVCVCILFFTADLMIPFLPLVNDAAMDIDINISVLILSVMRLFASY